ncbi:hypothetical protein [Streptomyces sp. NPDC019937]|uniref:hypothetical protein n=1 Tax=Streptomyces sp. NPDC019937 TaxID=3154787 RepID=UPI003402F526
MTGGELTLGAVLARLEEREREIAAQAEQITQLTAVLDLGLCPPGALYIVRDDEVSQQNPIDGRRELDHLTPPLACVIPLTTGSK